MTIRLSRGKDCTSNYGTDLKLPIKMFWNRNFRNIRQIFTSRTTHTHTGGGEINSINAISRRLGNDRNKFNEKCTV